MKNSNEAEPMSVCHVVAMPFPGRGHINPMMNLCKLLVARDESIHVTFLVTEEWLGYIGSDPKPDRIRFGAIPNVVPSELVRSRDTVGFIEATLTKMEAPFEEFLDGLQPSQKPRLIIADSFLLWVVGVGNRRSIKVASFWPMPASVFLVYHRSHLLEQNGHFPANLAEKGSVVVDYMLGLSPTRLVDLPIIFEHTRAKFVKDMQRALTWVSKSHCLLFSTVYELEAQAIDALKRELSTPIYTIGPTIPYTITIPTDPVSPKEDPCLEWLDRQPRGSVLYVSMGSVHHVSSPQMDEIAAGLRESGARFLWVARAEAERLGGLSAAGLVVPWCAQERVLLHTSVGGFWSHCGWNSVKEGVFAGVPFLTFPIVMDQMLNSKFIVEDWKTGWKVKRDPLGGLVGREEIGGLVRRFMGMESGDDEAVELRRRAKELQETCCSSVGEDGSCEADFTAFLNDVSSLTSH